MKGRLLYYVESFCWINKELDRSKALQDFNTALNTARKCGDQVFCPEIMYNPENRDIIFQFMWLNGYQSYEELKVNFEWLQVDDFQLLQTISYSLGQPTPNSSNDWEAFSKEFSEENRSLIGLKDDNCINPLVYDIVTHTEFHSSYVATFDFDRQKAQYEYFRKYYKPSLKLESGQIINLIQRHQVNNQIIRLDSPDSSPNGNPIHGQQIHIHIMVNGNECALNIDGSWKHSPQLHTNNRISAEVCLTLSQWGFCLPEQYYD